jgi:ddrB-like ParB superfamily domain/Large polyvalent protein associated domain 38
MADEFINPFAPSVSPDGFVNPFEYAPVKKPEPPPKEGHMANVQRGTESMLSSQRTALESIAGGNEAAEAARKRQEDIAKRLGQPDRFEKVKTAYEKEGLLPAIGEYIKQVPGALEEQAPQIAEQMIASRLGAVAGAGVGSVVPGVGTAIGSGVGSVAGLITPSFLQQYGGNIERQAEEQRRAGKPVDVNRTMAALAAIPQAALDVAETFIPMGKSLAGALFGKDVSRIIYRGVTQEVKREAAEKLAKEGLAKTLAMGTAKGALAEIPTEVAQQALERAQAGLSLTDDEAMAEYGRTAFETSMLSPIGALGRVTEKSAAKSFLERPGPPQYEAIDMAGYHDKNKAAPGYEQAFQNRERDTATHQDQIKEISKNPDYDQMGTGELFGTGAPVVTTSVKLPEEHMGEITHSISESGKYVPVQYAVVEADTLTPTKKADGTPNAEYSDVEKAAIRPVAGNGRVAGIQEAYAQGNATDYKNKLLQDDTHGIDKNVIAGMNEPVLVRVIPKRVLTPDLIAGLNVKPVEQAQRDAQHIDPSKMSFNPDGTLTETSVKEFVSQVPRTEHGDLVHPTTGDITDTARNRLRNALLYKAYGHDPIIDTHEQARDPNSKKAVNGLVAAAPEMSKLDGAGNYDVRQTVADASTAYMHAINQGLTDAQMDAISNGLQPNEKKVFDFLRESNDQKMVGFALNRLASLASKQVQEPDVTKRMPLDQLFDSLKDTYFEVAEPTLNQMKKDLRGATMSEAASYAVDRAPNSFIKEIMEKVKDRIIEFDKRGVPMSFAFENLPRNELGHVKDITSAGRNLRFDLRLNEHTADYETLAHELIHVASLAEYLVLESDNPQVKAIEELYQIAKAKFDIDKKIPGKLSSQAINRINYAFRQYGKAPGPTYRPEFITMGLSNKLVQEYFATIKVGEKSAFTKLVEYVGRLIGISPAYESVLEKLIAVSSEMFETPAFDLATEVEKKGYILGTPTGTAVPNINVKPKQIVFASKAAPVPTKTGQDALDTLTRMNRQVQGPPENFKQKLQGYYRDFQKTPNKTEAAKAAFNKFYDKFSTKVFATDSALNNNIRRAIEASGAAIPDKIKTLLHISQSQTVHADALGNRFLMDGNLVYEKDTYKWKSVKDKDNLIALANQLDTMAKKHGLTKEQAELIAHTAFEAKRLKSIQEYNKTAKKKDQKFVHLTDQQIQDGLNLFKTMPELNKIVDIWNGMRNNAGKILVDSGLWSPEEADILLSNIDYVPFYREDQIELNQGPKEFISGLQVQAKERKMTGSQQPVHDVFDNMVRWTQYAVNRSIRNQSALSLIDASVASGLATKVPEPKRGMNAVKVWRDGKLEHYDMVDPLFVEAFNGLESIAIPTVKYFSKIADVLRKSVVMYPLFSVSQVPQDAFAAIFSSGLKPQYALSIPARAVKEFVKTLMNTSTTFDELKKYGVVGVRDYSATAARMDAEVFAGIKAPPGLIGQIKQKLEHISMASDNAVRQAVYEAAMAQGLDKGQALEKAFEVINFRKRGSSKMLILAGQTIPFFNAYIAAQSVAVKTITGQGISPQERGDALKTLAATTGSVMALSLLYAMMNGDDEDYLKKSATIRDRLIMIPGTGGLSIPLRTDLFTIPKILTEHMYLLMTNNGTEDGRKFRDSMVSALGNALLSPTPVPQAVKPLLEVKVNYDFFQGKPLIGKWQEQLDTERQFNESTSELAKLLGKTGIVSPINADHLIRGMFGSVGGLFLLTTNQILHSDPNVPKPEMTFREIVTSLPGTSGFVSKEFESGYKKDFYTLRDEVDRATATFSDIKKRSPAEAKEFLSHPENKARIAMHRSIDRIAKDLATIRTSINQISNMPESRMSAAEKEEKIRKLHETEVRILKNINLKKLREQAMI